MNMMAYGYWLRILYSTRMKIAELFHIPKSKYVHVVDNEVVEDGFTEDDLKNLTIEKMQHFLGTTDTDFYRLIDSVIDRIEGREALAKAGITEYPLVEEVDPLITESPQSSMDQVQPIQTKKRGRPAKIK